jgi:hypothetical protein
MPLRALLTFAIVCNLSSCGSKKQKEVAVTKPVTSVPETPTPMQNSEPATRAPKPGGETAKTAQDQNSSKAPSVNAPLDLSYRYILGGCNTAQHDLETKEALCVALQDKALNNGCAVELRAKRFSDAECPGKFEEFISAKAAAAQASGPSPVRCHGFVSGESGKKFIDKTVPWNRQGPQRIILSDYGELKGAGQYVADLIPSPEEGKPAAVQIAGIFMDYTKLQQVQGPLGSQVTLYHQDPTNHNREVNISCNFENPKPEDLPPLDYMKGGPVTITCFGINSTIRINNQSVPLIFTWDKKGSKTVEFQVAGENKVAPPVNLDFKVTTEFDTETQRPGLKIFGPAIDGHANVVGEVRGVLSVYLNYLSVLDKRKFEMSCVASEIKNEKK